MSVLKNHTNTQGNLEWFWFSIIRPKLHNHLRSPKSTPFTFLRISHLNKRLFGYCSRALKSMLSCIYFKTAIQHLFRNMIISKLTSPSKSAFFLLSLLWIVFSLQSQITLFVYFGKKHLLYQHSSIKHNSMR